MPSLLAPTSLADAISEVSRVPSKADALALSPQENGAAQQLREELAPVLSEAITLALRDQPADPAAYLADFFGGRSTGAAQMVEQRKLGQEVHTLDDEIASLKEQLDAARQERARRKPTAAEAEAVRDAAVAAASSSEVRRLKRLVRSIKVKLSEPLSASDWPLPEGVLLVQAARGMGAHVLCRQLATDFGVGHVEASQVISRQGSSADVLGTVADVIARHPRDAVLCEGFLDARSDPRELLEECLLRVGRPSALLLLHFENASAHVRRLQEAAATAGEALSQSAAEDLAQAWASHELPTLEAAARDQLLPVLRVPLVDGDFNAQMTSLLAALSLC